MKHIGRAMLALLALLASCGAGGSPLPANGSPLPANGMWHFYATANDGLVCEGTGHMPGTWYGACGSAPAAAVFSGNSNAWSLMPNGAFSVQLGSDSIDCPTPARFVPGLYLEASCTGFGGRSWNLYATGD